MPSKGNMSEMPGNEKGHRRQAQIAHVRGELLGHNQQLYQFKDVNTAGKILGTGSYGSVLKVSLA